MTEPTPFDDELLSAVLDHELPEEQSARLLDDPEAAARLRVLGAVRDAVQAPVEVPVGAVDRAVSAALAARVAARADTSELQAIPGAIPPAEDEPELAAPSRSSVTSLEDARIRRRRVMPALGAAATVLLLGVAAVAVWSGNRATSSVDTVAAPTPAEQSESGASAAADPPSSVEAGGRAAAPDRQGAGQAATAFDAETATSTTAARPTTTLAGGADVTTVTGGADVGTALGDFTEPEVLGQQARALAPPALRIDASARQWAAASSPCPAAPDRGQILWWGTATLEGTPVVVQLLLEPTDALDLVALDAATCTLVVDLSS